MSEAHRRSASAKTTALVVVSIIGGAALVASLFFNVTAFFHAYLVAFIFWLGIALGATGWLMIHHLSGGHWGWAMRRPMAAAASTMPVFALAFLPLLLGLSELYPWASHTAAEAGEALEHQKLYLNTPLFIGRAVLYFAAWIVFSLALSRPRARAGYTQPLAAGGMVVLCLTITFAAIDWIMALEAKWYSSMFGFYLIIGFGVSAWGALIIFTLAPLRDKNYNQLNHEELSLSRDLGNLLLACVVLHAYIAFSQYFIIWNGNTSHEILWYIPRQNGLWRAFIVVLMLLYFFLPFAALLFRALKCRPRFLMGVAAVVVLSQMISMMWMVLPGMNREGRWLPALGQVALSMLAIIAFGGGWMRLFLWRWRQMPEPAGQPAIAPAAGQEASI